MSDQAARLAEVAHQIDRFVNGGYADGAVHEATLREIAKNARAALAAAHRETDTQLAINAKLLLLNAQHIERERTLREALREIERGPNPDDSSGWTHFPYKAQALARAALAAASVGEGAQHD